jgi:hypothetical protein
MVRGVAAVERGDRGAAEVAGAAHACGVFCAQPRMLGQEAEADHQVGFAAAHRLLEVKDGLRGATGEARDALADQALHTFGDVRARKECFPILFVGDQFVQLLDLVAELDRERVVLELTGVTNGFHL